MMKRNMNVDDTQRYAGMPSVVKNMCVVRRSKDALGASKARHLFAEVGVYQAYAEYHHDGQAYHPACSLQHQQDGDCSDEHVHPRSRRRVSSDAGSW